MDKLDTGRPIVLMRMVEEADMAVVVVRSRVEEVEADLVGEEVRVVEVGGAHGRRVGEGHEIMKVKYVAFYLCQTSRRLLSHYYKP